MDKDLETYPTMTLAEYFKAKKLPLRFAMMRHDIDRKPMRALNTARVEQELGNKATVVHWTGFTGQETDWIKRELHQQHHLMDRMVE